MCESRSKELSGDTNLPITWPLSEQPRWMQCEASRASGSLPSSFQSGQKRNELWIPPSFKVLKQGHRFLSLQSALADWILSHGLKRGPIKLTPSLLPKSEELFLEHLMERASDGASLWLQLGRLPLDSLKFSIPNFLVELPNTTLSPTVICHRPKNRTKNTNFESLSPKETKKKPKRKKTSMPSTSQPSAYQMLWILELWEGGGTCKEPEHFLPFHSHPHAPLGAPDQNHTEKLQSLRRRLRGPRNYWASQPHSQYAPPGQLIKMLLLLCRFSRVWLCATPQTAAHQAPSSLGFSRQEQWSGLPFPSPMHESGKWKWSRSVMSDSSRPHGLQPTSLLRPWDFPGKSSGVGCHCHQDTRGWLVFPFTLRSKVPAWEAGLPVQRNENLRKKLT